LNDLLEMTTTTPSGTTDRNPPSDGKSKLSNRIEALDFTKGTLVLVMVVYHWLSTFQGPQGFIYRYLRFLPPSFIFITGFLVSNAYLARYGLTDPRLPKRLLGRGLKILALFIALNAAISFLLTGFRNVTVENLEAVYVSGNVFVAGVGKTASFYILVPIAYLLLLSAALLILCRFFKYTFYVVCVAALVANFVLNYQGLKSGNLELVTVGLLGLILGYIPIEKINSFVKHPFIVIGAYLCYTVAITLEEPNYAMQIIGVFVTLMLIYSIGARNLDPSMARRLVTLLGRYPLFGYIAQIAILQVLRIGLRRLGPNPELLALSFVAAVILTVLAVIAMDRARSKSSAVDRIYKVVFA
jgi:hypothetical protein